MGNAPQKQLKGWFNTPGRPGDRTFEQQLLGLDQLFSECQGKTVLDVGAAEGLISIELARRGALAVHGLEVVANHVKVGRTLVGDLPVTLEVADADTWQPRRQYDIVIALALLHKLKDPSRVAHRLANACKDLMVLRLPPANGHMIIDGRSGCKPHYIDRAMVDAGFEVEHTSYDGPFGEFVSYWRRKQK